MRERVRSALPAVVGVALFVAALEVLRHELGVVSWPVLVADVLNVPPARLGAAVALTAMNYAALAGYDFIALAAIGRSLPRRRVAAVSFLSYAIANNVGFAMLTGASVRYRFYTRWGLTAHELSRVIVSYSVTFWLGLLALGGVSLAVWPLASNDIPVARLMRPSGSLLAIASVAYVGAAVWWKRTIRFGSLDLTLPAPHLAAAQLVVSIVEWGLAGAVFYVLLPEGGATYPVVLAAFLAAQLLGLASHVPGGAGVFEGLIVVLLRPYWSAGQLLPSLVVYRTVYYLLPLVIALAGLVLDEASQRRPQAARAGAYFGWLTERLTPRVLAAFTFLGGAVLLFSGAPPAAEGRLRWLDRLVPLGVIETSHFAGSLVGAALLLLSQGLARRLDAAYYFAQGAIAIGVAASLLKGADVEEAAILALLGLALRRARPAFDRKAAFFQTRFSASWIAAVAAVIAASVWLGTFAFKHVEYSSDLWWQFELDGEASRFLRGSVGAATLMFLFAGARLMSPAPHEAREPDDEDLDAARRAIAAQPFTSPNLVYLRDKTILFNEARTGFVMYSVQGRTWVAMGDPVGKEESVSELVRVFLEAADDFGGTPVFYQARKEWLHYYADFGLAFVKLGEEARVDLARFGLDGSRGAKYRQVVKRLEKDGATFRVVPAEDVPTIVDQLREVSDDWLAEKAGGEKGFSLGFFDSQYLSRFPAAIVEREGRVVAFANVWPGAGQGELSVDLMRYHRSAPKNVMEALLVHTMCWGKEQGYAWFALGMAPLSGFERSAVAPLWARLGHLLYKRGDALYNFQGLRAYKQKFDPVWEPRYLGYPGGLRLPRVLIDVTALVAGGYRRIFSK